MTDSEAMAILDLLPEDDGQALALVLAAFAERRREQHDLMAISRVQRWALDICQSRKVGS